MGLCFWFCLCLVFWFWREKAEGDKFGGLGRKGVEGGGDRKVMVGTQSVWQ